jgi:hypothetical protein
MNPVIGCSSLSWGFGSRIFFNFDLRSVQTSTTVVATEEGEISFCAYNSAGWREAVERIHRTATLTDWHEQHGRHSIFAGGKLVPITSLVGPRSQ